MRRAVLGAFLLAAALAQGPSGSLELRAEARYLPGLGAFTLEPVYAGSWLASAAWGDAYVEAALYPSWNLATDRLDAGVSKLDIGYGNGRFALGLGVSPEPTATLRLVPPFALVVPAADHPPGLAGAWFEAYPAPARRLRLALRRVSERPVGLVRTDGRLGAVDYQLFALYGPAPAPAALGMGASTRAGSWIVYGEAWRRWRSPEPWSGGVGASRYLAGGLFTVEAAYAQGWRLAAGYGGQLAEAWTLDALARIAWPSGGPGALYAGARLTYLGPEGDVMLGLACAHDPARGTAWLPVLGARVYY